MNKIRGKPAARELHPTAPVICGESSPRPIYRVTQVGGCDAGDAGPVYAPHRGQWRRYTGSNAQASDVSIVTGDVPQKGGSVRGTPAWRDRTSPNAAGQRALRLRGKLRAGRTGNGMVAHRSLTPKRIVSPVDRLGTYGQKIWRRVTPGRWSSSCCSRSDSRRPSCSTKSRWVLSINPPSPFSPPPPTLIFRAFVLLSRPSPLNPPFAQVGAHVDAAAVPRRRSNRHNRAVGQPHPERERERGRLAFVIPRVNSF